MRKTLLSVLVAAGCSLAAPAHAVEVSEGDIDFLFMLSRMSPSSHMAALYIANECHTVPTQRFVETVFHTDEYIAALTAFLDRLAVEPVATEDGQAARGPARPFPEIQDTFCDRVKLTTAHVARGYD